MSTKELPPKRNSILIGIAAVILLAIAGLSYRQWSQYALANADAAQTRDIIQSVDRLLLSLVDAETGQRGFLLTGEDRYLEPYNRSIQAIPTELSQLSKLLASRPNESGNLSRLDRLIDEKLSELQQTISIRQTQGAAPARNIVLSDEGKRRMDEIRSVSSAILTSQNLLENRASLDREGVARITLLATIAGGLILLFFFVFGFDPIVLRDPQVKGQQWPGTYGAAVVSTGMAVLLRLSLTPLIGSTAVPFITFFPAVLFSAWYGGFRVGMFSIVLSTVTADYFFVSPTHSFQVPTSVDQVTLLIFVVVGFSMALLAQSQRRAVGRAEEQRQQLETTLASIGDAVIATDAEGHVTFINPVAESLTGWKREDALRQPLERIFQIVNEDTRQPVENPALRAMQEGQIVGLANHTVLITRTGSDIPIDDSGSPIIGPNGPPLGAVLIFRDITERRRADKERELLAQQARMLSSGFDAIIVRDSQDRITSWNRVAEELYGWSAEEAIGQPKHPLFRTVFPKSLDEITRDLHRDNRWEGELVQRRKDGSLVTVLSHWVLDRGAQGGPRSVLEINIDISARKRAEEALQEQREWLRVTLASIGDGVIATDTKGAVTFLNPVAELLTGWKQDEALGQPLETVFPIVNERTRRPVENPALRAMQEGVIVGLANHTVLITRDRKEIPIDDAGSPIRDAVGKILGAVLIFRDVSERRGIERLQAELFEREHLARQNERNAREEAEAAELRLQLALDAGRMGTWQYSMRTAKVAWSPGLEQIHGYKPGTFPGTFDAFQDEIHPDDRERVIQAIGEAIEHRRDHHVEYKIVRRDGATRWVEGRGRLFLDADENPDRMVGVCADITDRKHAADAESQARRAAEDANRAKDEFLAMLSHELRNPLSAVIGWVKILRTGQMPLDRADHALEVIERNAQVETQLVDSLLDLSRIAAGKLQLDSQRVDLPAFVQAIVDSVRPSADSKNINVEVTPPPGPVITIADSARMQQIFSNPLANAVKFTPNGGRIQVRITRTGSHAQIQVIDNGEGIEAEFLPRVFDRFRQAETTKRRSHGGLGLGLTIVRELVHAHQGTILAESPGKGKGSTFTVTLPIPAVIPAHIEAASLRPLHAGEHSIAGLRILVVDDQADARELVRLTLQSRGGVVQLASSASEALRSMSHDKPDVMIADIGMPGEDGYVLIQTLRAVEREHSHKRLPAIALTAYATTADCDQALAAGYDLHLAKPVAPSDLTQALSKFRKTQEREA